MKAVYFDEHGGRDVLRYAENFPEPTLAQGQVLIRTRASSLNRIDLVVRSGYPGISISMPHVLGGDICGEIAGLGSGVTDLTLGTRVVAYPLVWCGECDHCRAGKHNLCVKWQYFGVHRHGGYADHIAVPAANVVVLPDDVSFIQGASLPVAGITALHAIKTVGELVAGQTCLIWGAAGGLGSFAVQIAKNIGATVIAVVSSDERGYMAANIGADHVINRLEEEVAVRVRQIAPGGIDLALDFVGPATFPLTFDLLKKGGTMLICGIITGRETNFSLHITYLRHLSIKGLYLGTVDELRELVNLVAAGAVKPMISDTLPLKDAAEAHRRLESGSVAGKLVLSVD